MERPAALEGRTTLTDEEVAQLESADQARADRAPRAGDPGTYNAFWTDRGRRSGQTSMVVDPPDGKFPPLTAVGQQAQKSRARGADSWEDRHLWERCITRGGMPNAMFPRAYNNNAQIFQTPEYVVILLEEIHETRIIPLDGRAHLPQQVRQWMGDSRGSWEQDTLVVDTTNIAGKVSALQPWANFNSIDGSQQTLHTVERFRRVDANTISYTITVNDPQMYTRPWTVEFPMEKTAELLYEYACHEGNYGMFGILTGGRADEKVNPEAASSGQPGAPERRPR
ncbi:MAG: hypothetical protein GEU82_03955 [Luteitalea sp.]|nr:hypothetical protein [Luteitalea sp.]